MYVESRYCHKLLVGTAKTRKQEREKIGDREESRGRGCTHYMKNLTQIKEISLDFKETKNMASFKVKTYFALCLCLWGGGGFGRFQCNNNLSRHWCCKSMRQFAFLCSRPLLSQRGSHWVHPHSWQTLCQ